MPTTSTFTGGCLCGAIRFHALSEPIRGVMCHCVQCRKHSGAPALAFVHFRSEDFKWLSGTPTRFRSSEFAERGFCSVCGSTLSMHESILTDRVQVTVGSLDEPERVHLDDQVWTSQRISWFDTNDSLPRFPHSSLSVPTRAIGPEAGT